MDANKVNSEVTHGNFALESLLKDIVHELGSLPLTGRVYVAISTSDVFYPEFSKNYNKRYADGSQMVQTTIQAALDTATDDDVVLVKAKDMAAGATDPSSWAETLIIAAGKSNLKLIGLSTNRTQGGLPQIKIGAGSTAMLTVRAPGCLIANLGFNGIDSTGGGILLDDDASTKSAFGTEIRNCHFKNCVGTTATDSRTGGAIMWSSAGGAWQVRIVGNRFYKNVGDIVLKGTSVAVPQDVVIEDNIFSGPAASVDSNLYLAGGSGMNGVIIRNNEFTAFPALGSGSVLRFADLTGCVGTMVGNSFATSTTLTFGATGTGAKVPTTVFMPKNYRETTTGVSSEVFRT